MRETLAGAIANGCVYAVEHEAVEVWVGIQGFPKTRHKRDGATLGTGVTLCMMSINLSE